MCTIALLLQLVHLSPNFHSPEFSKFIGFKFRHLKLPLFCKESQRSSICFFDFVSWYWGLAMKPTLTLNTRTIGVPQHIRTKFSLVILKIASSCSSDIKYVKKKVKQSTTVTLSTWSDAPISLPRCPSYMKSTLVYWKIPRGLERWLSG